MPACQIVIFAEYRDGGVCQRAMSLANHWWLWRCFLHGTHRWTQKASHLFKILFMLCQTSVTWTLNIEQPCSYYTHMLYKVTTTKPIFDWLHFSRWWFLQHAGWCLQCSSWLPEETDGRHHQGEREVGAQLSGIRKYRIQGPLAGRSVCCLGNLLLLLWLHICSHQGQGGTMHTRQEKVTFKIIITLRIPGIPSCLELQQGQSWLQDKGRRAW